MKKPTWVPPTLWFPLDSPFLPVPDAPAQDLPCPGQEVTGLDIWAPVLSGSSLLCGRPFFYLSLVPAAYCKWVMSQPCEQQQGKVASRVSSTEDIRSTEPATTEQTKLISLAIFTHQFTPPLSLSPPHPLFFLSACFVFSMYE